jgi:hypothetical protein
MDSCNYCGTEADAFAFVRYGADPNSAQKACDWFGDVAPVIYSIVCTNCGLGQCVVDPRDDDLPDYEDLPHGTDEVASPFKVEEELE